MKGHLKLDDKDLVLAKLQNGMEYIESDEVDGSILNTYLQNGCILLKDKILRYVYDDFSGGDMQETYSLLDVHYKTSNVDLKPQTSANYSSLAFFNKTLSVSEAITPNEYTFEEVIEHNENVYILAQKNEDKILYKNFISIATNIISIFIYKNTLYKIIKDNDKYYYSINDDSETQEINWTHKPCRIIYEEPYLYTFDEEGNVRLFSPQLLNGYMPV